MHKVFAVIAFGVLLNSLRAAPDAESYYREALKAYQAKQYARVIPLSEKAYALSPTLKYADNLTWYQVQGTNTRNYEAALALLDNWLQSKREFWALSRKGVALSRLERPTEALSVLKEAVEVGKASGAPIQDVLAPIAEAAHIHNNYYQNFESAIAQYTEATSISAEALNQPLFREAALAYFWLGLEKFGAGDYDGALSLLQSADNLRNRIPEFARVSRWESLDWAQQTVQKRKTLGNIQPEFTDRIYNLIIPRTEIEGVIGGKKISAHSNIPQQKLRKLKILQGYMTRIVELASGGRMTLQIESEYSNLTVTGADIDGRGFYGPKLGSMEPDFSAIVAPRLSTNHVFWVVYEKSRFPANERLGLGGTMKVPLKSGLVRRRFMMTPFGWADSVPEKVVMYTHEYLHSFEHALGIKLMHRPDSEYARATPGGYRHESEIDFTEQQFQSTIPAKISENSLGWGILEYARQYPVP